MATLSKFSLVGSGFREAYFFKCFSTCYMKIKINPCDSSFIPFSAPKTPANHNIHTLNGFPF